jgi:ATPase subunit of ABC transporter with duplicated ATPase domains
MLYAERLCHAPAARDRLGAFGFSGEDVFQERGGDLSGGER